ncbi:metalloproteinase inhibitor 1 [Mantella aurantiaca]
MFALVVLIVLGCLSQEAWSCTCAARHPQSVYCDSAIVIRAKFVGQKVSEKNSHRVQYNIKTTKVFKAPKGYEDIQYLHTPISESVCGYQHSSTNKSEEFILAAHIVDEDVFINSCSFIAPWASLTSTQKKGFINVYGKYCNCQIKECSFVPCEIDDNQCLWTDNLGRQRSRYPGRQATNLACVSNSEGLCTWSSLNSRVFSNSPNLLSSKV